MARIAILCLISLALVALSHSSPVPEPKPFIGGIMKSLQGMMGGGSKKGGSRARSSGGHDMGNMMNGIHEHFGKKMARMPRMPRLQMPRLPSHEGLMDGFGDMVSRMPRMRIPRNRGMGGMMDGIMNHFSNHFNN